MPAARLDARSARHHGPSRRGPGGGEPASSCARPERRRRLAASRPHTCSAMPSDAVSPVERIAATWIEAAGTRRAARSRSCTPRPGRAQPGVAGDRLGAVERGQHRSRLRAAPRRAPSARTLQSSLSSWSCAVGPGDDPAVERREDEHALRRAARAPAAGSARAARRPAARTRGTRPCAGRSRSSSSPARRATSSARRPGAVDDDARARAARRRRPRATSAVAVARASPSTRAPTRTLGAARRSRRPRARACSATGSVTLSPGTTSAPSAPQLDVDAVARARGARGRRDRGALDRRRAARATAPQRSTGTPSASSTGSRSVRGAQDQLGLELAGRRVEAGVQDAGVRAARRQREPGLGLEQDRRRRRAGERERDRGADDAAADHGDLAPRGLDKPPPG